MPSNAMRVDSKDTISCAKQHHSFELFELMSTMAKICERITIVGICYISLKYFEKFT